MPMGQSSSTQAPSTVPFAPGGNRSIGSENSSNRGVAYNANQAQPHPVTASGLTSERDRIFQCVLRFYFHENSLADLRSADRLSRNEEGIDNYRPGGYHKVNRGQLYNQRYLIVSKLGWGHFSTVWLAADLATYRPTSSPPCQHVALKVQKGESSYHEAALDEIRLLQRVCDRSYGSIEETPVTHMLDSFMIVGPNGKHMCTVFEVLGENLLQLLKRSPSRRLPMSSVKQIASDILRGLDFLHRQCSIIHTDLKPENVLIASADPLLSHQLSQGTYYGGPPTHHPIATCTVDIDREGTGYSQKYPHVLPRLPSRGRPGLPSIKIADLGNACWTDHHFTDYITTRQYRSPEIILKAPYSCSTDMWSFACLCFELITGDYLFDPKRNKAKGYTRNDDHLALMMELMGPAPVGLLNSGQHKDAIAHKYFDSQGRLIRISHLDFWSLPDLLQHKYKFSAEVAGAISSFLSPMLRLDPNTRSSAAEMLAHAWLRETPDYSARQLVSTGKISSFPVPLADRSRKRDQKPSTPGLGRRAVPSSATLNAQQMPVSGRTQMQGRRVPVPRLDVQQIHASSSHHRPSANVPPSDSWRLSQDFRPVRCGLLSANSHEG